MAPPAAYADVYISGRVVDTNGDPAVGVQADAFKWDGDSWEGAGWSLTDDQGSYTRVLPEAGLYRMCFWDLAGVWVSEWYNDATFLEDAVTFDLADGASQTGVNAVLARAGSISGTVTNAGGDPLEGIEVDVLHYYPQIDEWRGCGQVTTGADGTYSHGGLTPGVHHVLFHDPSDLYADEDYNDHFHNEGFDNVEVLSGQTTGGIDASLEEAATISGYVTGDPAMTPLTGIHVVAHRYVEGMGWPGIMDTYTTSGAYQLGGLPPGDYRITFEDQTDVYLDEWWNDKREWNDADAVELTAGESQGGLNADLALPGHVTGTVTGGGGAGALEGMHVTVHVMNGGQPGPPVAETWTGGDGTYDVGGLMPGVYRVRFEDSTAGLWVPQWYDGVRYPDAAADVTVQSGGAAGGIDAELLPGGAISGTVRNDGGTGLDNINVSVHQRIDGFWQWVDGTSSAGDGTYRIGGLAPGVYRLTVNDRDGEYADEAFEDAISLDQGRDLEVGAASTAVADPVMSPGGRIMGQVADNHGQPLEGIDVVFLAWVDDQGVPGGGLWAPYSRATTASNGFFNQSGIRTGANVVQFSDPDGVFLGEFFNHVEHVEQAQQVMITAGTTQGLGVINLAHQGSIAGRVANAQDEPLEGIEVDVLRWDDGAQDWVGCGVVTTGPDGTYTHGGLRAGMYQVWFRDPSGTYVGEAYNDVQPGPEQQPTQVPLGPGMAATGIDASLELGASISGMVTGIAAMPLSGIHVTAERDISGGYGDWQGFSEAISVDGIYELGGLPAGTYRVRFWDDTGFYAPQFWEGVVRDSEATLIDLPAGGTQPGVNASLTLAGHIVGTVTGEGAGAIQYVTVSVHRFNGEWYDWMGSTETQPDGSYDIGGLAPGAYRVSFGAPSEGYWASEWYLDATSMEEGQDVNVGDGGFVVADAELGVGGGISGTVRNESGEPLAYMDISAFRMRVEGDETWWDGIGGVQTAEDGTYRIGGLPPGTYQFEINDGWSGDYAVEVYENARNVGEGIDIPVVAGQDTTGVDPVLGLGGRIAGRVVDEGGQPLQGIMVQFDAWVDDTEGGHWEWYTETWTDPEGLFEMNGLVATRTLVHFTDESGAHAGEYYDDAANQEDAYQVIVTRGQLTDIGDVVLGPPGRISGTVTDGEGRPLQGIDVMFNVWNSEGWWDGVDIGRPWPQTDENGYYEYSGLGPGLYQVWAQDPGGTYAMSVFPEATIVAGQTTTVDLAMELAASISGLVTGGPLNEPLSGIWVNADRWVGDEYGGWEWAGGTEHGVGRLRVERPARRHLPRQLL